MEEEPPPPLVAATSRHAAAAPASAPSFSWDCMNSLPGRSRRGTTPVQKGARAA